MPDLIDERYRILRTLGAGAMGPVYLAEDVALRRFVALKVIDSEQAAPPEVVATFVHEVRTIATLESPHVVRIYACGSFGASFYVAMEHVRGESLDKILQRHVDEGKRFDVDWTVAILEAVASGLGAVHAKNVTHRDVKPANIVIEAESGRPVLVDFGVALARDPSSTIDGTPEYISPEQVRNDPDLGPAADTYSLACTAFEMLTGEPVFPYGSVDALLRAHVQETPRLVSSIRSDLVTFDEVIEQGLAKRPEDRFASATAFVRAMVHANDARSSLTGTQQRASRLARVVVLAAEPSLRRTLVREVMRALDNGESSAELVCASTVRESIAAFANEPCDVVIIDDASADGRALELIARIRQMPYGTAAVVALVTSDVGANVVAAKALGAHCLGKPLNGYAVRAMLGQPRLDGGRRVIRSGW